MAVHYVLTVPLGGQHIIRCRLSACFDRIPPSLRENCFDEMVNRRKNEADEFYKTVIPGNKRFYVFLCFLNSVKRRMELKGKFADSTLA